MHRSRVLFLIVCTVPLLAACHAHPQAVENASAVLRRGTQLRVPPQSPLRGALPIGTVVRRPITPTIETPGVVEALPERLVKLVAPVSGRIVSLAHGLGDPVKAGETLFVIDSVDLANAYADDGKAQSALRQAQREAQRQQALLSGDVATKKDAEAAQLDLAQAQDQARAARERLAQLGADPMAASHRRYAMRSPIDGRISDIAASLGGYWNDTTATAMTVADISKVWVNAQVAERDIGQVFVGQHAQIHVDAYPDASFEGTVQHIADLLDTDTRTLTVRIAIDNRDGRLKPGMFARVGLAARSRSVLLVPTTALLQSGLSTRVYVEMAPFVYVSRVVATGATLGSDTEITAGLAPGERVVVGNGALLDD
ncbi:efflux RND transporter periplasmic adaptor subunit [Xanthomonas albilineans]|uniref:efflux RND transporter periplasmic adaptor subunit n=1 Tax=Xanthomonas albilineans TaxID=29447 RepID=UPI0005F31DFC|nr:efflux RND transporter periplasmic adaptor subunit [Xanthomonas albilineans]